MTGIILPATVQILYSVLSGRAIVEVYNRDGVKGLD